MSLSEVAFKSTTTFLGLATVVSGKIVYGMRGKRSNPNFPVVARDL